MSNIFSFLIKSVLLLHLGMLYAQTFTNPVLPGGYPDPSICKVGDYFYMANSILCEDFEQLLFDIM